MEFDVRISDARVAADERESILAAPGFCEVFTDHMITIRWDDGHGWHDARLEPYGPFTLDPATSVFHYAQEIFEGLKAYRTGTDAIVAFRPQANAARFSRTAARMAMPELPAELFLKSLELLVTQRGLGVNRPSRSYLFCVIASPVASYFHEGIHPVTVWLSEEYSRAAPGGTGEAKCGGNYAASFAGQQQAVAHGCDQVVWLDALEHRLVEEMGGMNLFFVYGSGPHGRLVTPALTGTLLPGVTRDTLLKLGPDPGIPAEEASISVAEWREGCESGELTEVFACGTAAVITPVGRVKGPSGEWTVGDGNPGLITMRLREELLGIQYGNRPDPYGWVHKLA
jgi:branched-chain amino acid aminotransferase